MVKNPSGLLLPKLDRSKMPRFTERMFLCYYEQDVFKFKELVESKGGIFGGAGCIPFLNFKNQEVSKQFAIIYFYHENISMEVLC